MQNTLLGKPKRDTSDYLSRKNHILWSTEALIKTKHMNAAEQIYVVLLSLTLCEMETRALKNILKIKMDNYVTINIPWSA